VLRCCWLVGMVGRSLLAGARLPPITKSAAVARSRQPSTRRSSSTRHAHKNKPAPLSTRSPRRLTRIKDGERERRTLLSLRRPLLSSPLRLPPLSFTLALSRSAAHQRRAPPSTSLSQPSPTRELRLLLPLVSSLARSCVQQQQQAPPHQHPHHHVQASADVGQIRSARAPQEHRVAAPPVDARAAAGQCRHETR